MFSYKVLALSCSIASVWAATSSLFATSEPIKVGGVTMSSDARIAIGGIRFAIAYFGNEWSTFASNEKFGMANGFPKVTEKEISVSGNLEVPSQNTSFSIEQKVLLEDDGVRLSFQASHPVGIKTDTLCVTALIPLATGAGGSVVCENQDGEQEFALPLSYNGNLFDIFRVSRLTLPSPGGHITIEGSNLHVTIHDERRFGGSGYSLRLYFSPGSGLIKDSSLEFTVVKYDEAPDPFPTAKIEEGPDWAPYQNNLEIEPGGVFDRSAYIDAPAGKYGNVVVSPEGHFSFAEGNRRARFWGVNLCFQSLLLEHDEADRLAERLARAGYNSVRLHHYDGLLVDKNGSSFDLIPEHLDKLEYFFAALKKRGIYVTIDLYTFRGFPLNEIPDLGYALRYPLNTIFKLMVPVSENAFVAWTKFANNLLTHRNPYTGLTWAEDPALISVCLINEDSVFFGGLAKRKPELIALYEKSFDAWLKNQPPALRAGKSQDELFNRFLIDIKKASDARMTAFLRQIGVKCLVTSDNNINKEAQVLVRDEFDFVDNHEYWNHPVFLGSTVGVNQNSAILSGLWLPRELMPSRIFGKPYTVTEYNYCWPNAARAEAGVLMPAYAALQDWDAIYCFDYSSQNSSALFTPQTIDGSGAVFSVVADPIGMLTDRVAASLFLHANIVPATNAISYLADPELMFSGKRAEPPKLPEAVSWLGLITRVGTVPATKTGLEVLAERTNIQAFVQGAASNLKPQVTQPVFRNQQGRLAAELAQAKIIPPLSNDGVYRSETGQIEVSTAKGTAWLGTDSAECFVLPAGSQLDGQFVSVKNGNSFGAVYVMAVDGEPFSSSQRMLVLHLTDSLPSGTTFSDTNRNLLEEFGTLPHLVKRGSVQITISVQTQSAKWHAWAVDASGKRMRQIPVDQKDGKLMLNADTVTPDGVVLAYELTQEQPAANNDVGN